MYSQKYSNKPIQFISVNSFGKIVLHAEAVAFIRTLAPPISFASILGPSKTGKSFLMSQIISQSQPFVEQPTAGLWIWSKPILAYNQQNNVTSIILVDSEGFSMGEREKEKIIISLILLLSNCLLYNSIGPIDAISFNELQEVISIARELKEKNGEFHWILRDFDPSLVDKLGIYITPVQYMENMLMQAQNTSAQKTISSLKRSFPNRSCHCFVKPTPSSLQQPPQFLKQIIELRKRLNGVASTNLDGTSLVIIIQSFIDSLNSGDSIIKASQQGNDCKIRLQCLNKLGDQLRDLQQKQSANEIEDIDQHLSQIRNHLKEYYKQKMCSHRQIQTLDEQLNEIIQDFQDINDVQVQRNSYQSREIIRLNVPKEKMVRLSLNMSDSDKERLQFDSRQVISMNKINTAKSLQNRLEEFQTKIYRYELEATCSKRELQGLKDDYDKSKRQLDMKTDQIQSLIEDTTKKEKEYIDKIYNLTQQLQDLRKQKIMIESELQKTKILNNEKIVYLEQQICELSELKEFQLHQKQEKYKNKFNEYLKEIQQLKKSHQEQLVQLKKIYKDNQEQLIESKQNERNQTFYKEMREQMELLQKMKEEMEKQRFSKNEQLEINKQLKKLIQNKEEQYKDALQQQIKRGKESQRRLQQVYNAKLESKTKIIEQLQQKINDILKTKEKTEESTSEIIKENDRLIAQLEQKQRRLTKVNTMSEQTLRQLTKMKDYLEQCESTISSMSEQIKKKDEEISLVTSEKRILQDMQKTLQQKIADKARQIEHLQTETAQLKGQMSVLQETNDIQIEDLKEKYERQIQQIKQMFELQRQRLQNKIKELQGFADALRNLRQQYDELQQDSTQAQFQLRQSLDEKERELQSNKVYVQQLTRQCEILGKKNTQLIADIVRIKEESISNTRQSAQSEEKYRQQLQVNLQRSQQTNAEKDKTIFTLKLQLEKESKSSATKIDNLQKENDHVLSKLRSSNTELTKQVQKTKESLQQSQKEVLGLNQQIALLSHKLSLQQKSLSLKSQTKSMQLNKIQQKLKFLEAKNTEASSLASNYYEELKQQQQQSSKYKKMLSAYYKQKQIALSNIEEQSNRAKIAQRRYESHLNLFSEKLKEVKEENEQLRLRLEQYIKDYEIMSSMKENLQRTLEREMELSKNKLQIAYQLRRQ